MGYRLNVTARQFRERQTQMIGVLHGTGFHRPRLHGSSQYFAALMDGIIDGAFEHGLSVTLCPKLLGLSPQDAMTDGRFDGLVWYSTAPSGENRQMLERCAVPLVLIHTPASEFEDRIPTVMCDNSQGVGLAIDHLVSLGHRRIAFVSNATDTFAERDLRREAFVRLLCERGIEASDRDALEFTEGEMAVLFEALVGYTAVLAVSDGVAATILENAARFGIRIPDSLSVVGFDSTSFCLGLKPRLTAVSQPLTDMGRRAVDLLVESIHGELRFPVNLVLPCGLDVRDSTQSIQSR
jgi:LacI family transcriptional regulator